MENKRSIGVTILAALIILICLLLLFASCNQMGYLSASLRPFGSFFYSFSIFSNLLGIVVGINILRLKEWARICVIFFNIIFIVLFFVKPLIEGQSHYLSTSEIAEQKHLQLTPEQKNNYEKWKILREERRAKHPLKKEEYAKAEANIPKIIIFSEFMFLLWHILLIFFFTRPKVKEQFK